jgi:hypothetical protein
LGGLTYYVRRHRLDDYRGRYRVWQLVALVLVVAAVDQVAGLQQTVKQLLLHVGGIPHYQPATLVAVTITTVLAGALLVRLAIEMRECWLALVHLAPAAGCYGLLAAMQTGCLTALGWPATPDCVFQVMASSALTLGGHFLLWLAVAFYARHVHRDAQGLVAGRVRSRKAQRQPADKPTGHRTERTAAHKRSGQSTEQQPDQSEQQDGGRKRRSGANSTRRHAQSQTAPPDQDQPDQDQRHAGSSDSESREKGQRRRRKPAGDASPRPADKPTAGKKQSGHAADAPLPGSQAQEPADEADELDEGGEDGRKLTKAERRKLRKMRRRQRQQAA